jgi:hypothetical protein
VIHKAKPKPPPKVDCKQVLAKYPVETYAEQKGKKGGVYQGAQSHHVIQNCHFQKPRGTTVKGICPDYTEASAPCIPLDDGTDPASEHGRISNMQKADGVKYRKSGKNPTYPQARQDAKEQLTAKPEPGLKEEEAECILVKVDEHFEKICPGIKGKQLRTPRERGTWKPDIKRGARGAVRV